MPQQYILNEQDDNLFCIKTKIFDTEQECNKLM